MGGIIEACRAHGVAVMAIRIFAAGVIATDERTGREGAIRIARWQVANVLRLTGQSDEALAMQLALERDAAAAAAPDPYVYDELALLHAARGQTELAAQARARAEELRSGSRK